MPIKFNNVSSDLGIIVSECYARIAEYHGDSTNLTLAVGIYASKQAYDNGHRPVLTERIQIAVSELAKSNIFSYLYDNILEAEIFQQYSPTVIELPFTLPPTITDPSVTPDPNDLTSGGNTVPEEG